MKLFFISSCYARDSVELLRSYCKGKVGIQNQSNTFQWSIIKGLKENDSDFEVISFPALPIYPARFRHPFCPEADILYEGEKLGTMYSYCTIMGIKPLSIKKRLYKVIEKKINETPQDERVVLLLYTTNSYLTKALIPLSVKYPNVKLAAIITDLIDDAFNYRANNTFLKRIQIKKEIKAQKASYSSMDGFILLTKAMEEKIPEAIGRNIIVEGVCDRNINEIVVNNKNREEKTILYTGTLQKFCGIEDFVDAFSLTTDPCFRLVICGAGPSEKYILDKSVEDPRIIYKGVVKREEALLLQHSATVLVNPRKPTESITRYSFPSKTIEYLASGTPMMGYRLEGIPEEYYHYIYTPLDLSTHSMTDLINKVLSLSVDELDYRAQESLEFIKKNKTSKMQVKKIIEFLSI